MYKVPQSFVAFIRSRWHQFQIQVIHIKKLTAVTGCTMACRRYLPEPVVQSWVSANLGLNFNPLFWFMWFCANIRFKTLQNKTSVNGNAH